MDAGKVGSTRSVHTTPPPQAAVKSHPAGDYKPKKVEASDKKVQEAQYQIETNKNQKNTSTGKPSAAGEINVTA